jgi:hypothetical protein
MTSTGEALRLTKRLIRASPDASVARAAQKVQRLLTVMPMADILDKVPGSSIAAKAKALGVTRQTCYYWKDGASRPNLVLARRLAKLTGVPVEVIRGHVV